MTRTWARPQPGSDQIARAFEDAWVGTRGYRRADGTWQRRAIAFQGRVLTAAGEAISEAFIVDLPEDPTVPGEGPLAGTPTRAPAPPRGTVQRRLTYTADRRYPGLQGPRHWLRSPPDGSRIGVLMKDDAGVVQVWTISPNGESPVQVTRNPHSVASAFSWSPDGRRIAYVMHQSVFVTEAESGVTCRITPRVSDDGGPRVEACVFSPDGRRVAYVRPVLRDGRWYNQIFVAESAD